MPPKEHRALVTGATGYVGGRLVPALLEAGRTVRILTRDAGRVADRTWVEHVEVTEGDALDADVLARALDGVDVAYYLLHSMEGGRNFRERDLALAQTFAATAAAQGVGRIVYLSGLHPEHEDLSTHLASRVEVGEALMASGVPTAVLQAAVVVGAGSASFEMLRQLTRRLPLMVAPKWLSSRIQPIAIRDVLRYLVAAGDLPHDVNRAFDIGGPDVLTYRGMIREFAETAGLRRRIIITVPVLSPWLASQWVGLVTRVPSGTAKPLIGSLIHDVVCLENDIDGLLPDAAPDRLGFRASVAAALGGPAERVGAGTGDPAWLTTDDPAWAG